MTAGKCFAAPDMKSWKFPCWLAAILLLMIWGARLPARSQVPTTQTPPKVDDPVTTAGDGPIRFVFQPIDFKLDSCETPERHAPETMAGGVAVFDYNNDGKLDIFFTNGADIKTLHKSSAKYSNRLFENDGHGHFSDVTEKAGLAGITTDTKIFLSRAYIATRSTTTTGTELLPM